MLRPCPLGERVATCLALPRRLRMPDERTVWLHLPCRPRRTQCDAVVPKMAGGAAGPPVPAPMPVAPSTSRAGRAQPLALTVAAALLALVAAAVM